MLRPNREAALTRVGGIQRKLTGQSAPGQEEQEEQEEEPDFQPAQMWTIHFLEGSERSELRPRQSKTRSAIERTAEPRPPHP